MVPPHRKKNSPYVENILDVSKLTPMYHDELHHQMNKISLLFSLDARDDGNVYSMGLQCRLTEYSTVLNKLCLNLNMNLNLSSSAVESPASLKPSSKTDPQRCWCGSSISPQCRWPPAWRLAYHHCRRQYIPYSPYFAPCLYKQPNSNEMLIHSIIY